MLLSKSCIYAIRSALYITLEKDRKYIPVREIAERLQISFHFLTKILQILSKNHIVASYKGPTGGIMLLKSADEITLLDIILAIDGPGIFEECVLGLPGCSHEKPCPLHHHWNEQRKTIKNSLQNSYLSSVAKRIKNEDLRIFDENGLRNTTGIDLFH
ncbi:MAG: Rrf2 family transcriptional regulator [Calditrichaceae bacterium]